jgi:Na+/H+ antiporter NhaD and related arsenite permeases
MNSFFKKLNVAMLDFKDKLTVNARPRLKVILTYCARNWVVVLAILAAAVSCFFVKPDKEYLRYPEYKTLACLFSLLLILRSLKHTKIFKIGAAKILEHVSDRRTLTLLLIFLPALLSMLVTNDVATLSFVPFSIVLLTTAGCEKLIPRVLILQTMACRLSGAISPVGNAQNLFLINYYNLSPLWFIENLWLLALVGYAAIFLGYLTVKRGRIEVLPVGQYTIQKGKVSLYTVLFVLTLLSIFNVLPYYIITPIVAVVILIVHPFAYKKVKYSILLMFLAFFVLAGNLQRMESVDLFLSQTLSGREYVLSVLASQLMTNSPVALLFPNFTDNALPLIAGITVGKFGASQLNNYMVFNMYAKYDTTKTFGKKLLAVSFLFMFLLFPFGFLLLL